MEKFIIEGGARLAGEVTPSGNKNAALPLLAACILTDEPVTLHNMPDILDTRTMMELLVSLGVDIKKVGEKSWQVHAKQVEPANLDAQLCKQIRTSILFAGPMIARAGELDLAPPGGDVIGRRRVDTHILALQALGADAAYEVDKRMFHFEAKKGLTGADILLDETSVTATENAIMAAVLAKGDTILRNAASEPHVQDLCHFLNGLGAKIENIGSNKLNINGVTSLSGGEYTIGPDYLEVVSFIGAAAVTKGSIRIRQAGTHYLDMIRLVFNRMGLDWETDEDDVIVPADQELVILPDLGDAIPEIKVMPWPAFPPDLISIAIVVATQASGSMLFHDWMYNSRMYFTDKLVGMGAQIVLCDPHRCIVHGPTRLVGEQLESPDIRAGISLLLAALAANGQSVIGNISQIDRGYERVDEKLIKLGANIKRVTD